MPFFLMNTYDSLRDFQSQAYQTPYIAFHMEVLGLLVICPLYLEILGNIIPHNFVINSAHGFWLCLSKLCVLFSYENSGKFKNYSAINTCIFWNIVNIFNWFEWGSSIVMKTKTELRPPAKTKLFWFMLCLDPKNTAEFVWH